MHADGRTMAIRTPVNGEQRQLLGETCKRWLVAVRTGYRGRVIAVRPGRRSVEIRHTRTTTYGEGDAAVGWLLSHDGALLDSIAYGARITMDTWSITSQHEQTADWETDRRFVFQVRPGERCW